MAAHWATCGVCCSEVEAQADEASLPEADEDDD